MHSTGRLVPCETSCRETSQVVKTTGLDLEAKLNHDVGQESQDGPGKCAEMSNENPLNELHVTC